LRLMAFKLRGDKSGVDSGFDSNSGQLTSYVALEALWNNPDSSNRSLH